jgi:hypothetical protein
MLRGLALGPALVIYVRAYAAVWVALEDVDVDEPAALVEPIWLSSTLAVTIGASTASLHVLRLQSPMLVTVLFAVLFLLLEEAFGVHEYGTPQDVARLRTFLLNDEDETDEQ